MISGPRGAAGRGHRALPHTADAGIEASGPDLAAVFEEAAYGLAEMTADIEAEALLERDAGSLPRLEPIRLSAADLEGLAYAWLAELVGRVDVDGAIAAVEVEAVTEAEGGSDAGAPDGHPTNEGASDAPDRWSLRARVATLPFDAGRVRRRADVKAVTYHRLAVEPTDGGWRLSAYLDI